MHTMPTNKRRVFAYGHSVTAKFYPQQKEATTVPLTTEMRSEKCFWHDA